MKNRFGKRNHDAINGIVNGYYWIFRRRIRPRVTELLHKSVMLILVLVQCASDQVPEPRERNLKLCKEKINCSTNSISNVAEAKIVKPFESFI